MLKFDQRSVELFDSFVFIVWVDHNCFWKEGVGFVILQIYRVFDCIQRKKIVVRVRNRPEIGDYLVALIIASFVSCRIDKAMSCAQNES